MKTRIITVAVAFALLVPKLVEACPFCAGQGTSGRPSYYLTTALMVAVPGIMLGLAVFVLRRAVRKQQSSSRSVEEL